MSLSGSVTSLKKFEYINLIDEKTGSSAGGTFNSGTWQTRDLNTIKTDETGAVLLSSNQFTLPAGSYIINAVSPAKGVEKHKIKLRDITDSVDTIIGTSAYAGSLSDTSIIKGKFVTTSTKTFEIQHKCTSSKETDGFGSAAEAGVVEVYTVVELWKVTELNVLAVTC